MSTSPATSAAMPALCESPAILAGGNVPRDDGWQTLLVTMGRWAVARADVALVVQDAASLLAESLAADFGIVAKLIDDQRSFQVALTPRGNESPLIYQTPADDAQSLVGHVLGTGQPLAVTDLAADAPVKDSRLLATGARGLILCPLRFFNESFGALGVSTNQPREFRPRDTLLVEVAAHFITTAIAQHRAEQALAAERASCEILRATVDALVIDVSPAGRLLRMNAAAERITGFSTGE
ncbi:MAG TPA: GAF domain-containing protein, partial [Pirellulales bacterium]|nr:GAF domain-containing protein [Pirellulales bacterium]